MLDIDQLPHGHTLEKTLDNFFFNENETLYIVKSSTTLFFRKKSKLNEKQRAFFKKDIRHTEFRIPLSSLDWVIDTIENGFMKLPSEGGLPADTLHMKNLFDGQELKIRFSPNCMAEDEKGISILNLSVPSKVHNYSTIQLPYVSLLEQGILAELKRIAQNYKNA
ncbi:hypothetical protein [Pseudoalteromonas ruthenica]|uniref:hypothetical protein n=1 Tax=Pseudoalteromonas ruthenica TaxID=151081 RepID=UPI0012490450|nr:hypothetical protein [Pseudoalteromonas ruthenica]